MLTVLQSPLLIPLPLILGLILALVTGTDTAVWGVRWLETSTYSLVFVAFIVVLGWFVHRFAVTNLAGDPRRGRFLTHLTLTLWAVQGLAVSGNFALFLVFWMLTSTGLHQLLEHFRHRSGARIVAWEKFLVSRLGDLALIGAAVLLFLGHGSLNFAELLKSTPSAWDGWAVLLLVLGALTKSAQVPFHGWLPKTLEAPTPVSALLHAGVINAGGFLLIKFWFLLERNEAAQTAALIFGGLSALWGSLAMVVQSDVKRRLAWSTVGQMGFMMMEIGLGAPGLALVHLIGHGFYKSRAFLWSGDVSQTKVPPPVAIHTPLQPLVGLALWLGVGAGAWLALTVWAPDHLALALMAWAVLLPLAVGGWDRPAQGLRSLAAATGGLAASTVLALAAAAWLGLHESAPLDGVRWWAAVVIAAVLALTGLAVAIHPLLAGTRLYRQVYASALHGFALGRWPEAILDKLHPWKNLPEQGEQK